MSSPEHKQLSSGFSLLKPSWEGVRLNLVTLIELVLIPFLINLIGSILRNGKAGSFSIFVSIVGELVSLIFAPALLITFLKSSQQKKIEFNDALKAGLTYVWRYIGLSILISIVVIIGFLLLIVPGLIMIKRYILAPYYLVDRDMKVLEAMKASATDSKEFNVEIWQLIGVTILFVILAFLIVGIFLSIAYACANAILYREIKNATQPKSKTIQNQN